jgi:hypoxanthine phosphoribosyltransferase
MNKHYIEEEDLLQDGFRLGVQIYNSGFRPSFIVGLWRGGSSVGIVVQECLQHLGVKTDHISIRTSYRGMDSYEKMVAESQIRVHGTQYLLEHLNADDSLLIVDDVFSTGLNVKAVIERLNQRTKRNMPQQCRVAVPWYKPSRNQTGRVPDYYLYETDDWLILPYELRGLSSEEMEQHKPFASTILKGMRSVLRASVPGD